MNDEHPALLAYYSSWSCVHRKSKEEWLNLFDDDAVIEDPIGVSGLDPTGLGQRGKEAISAFWDSNIGPNTVSIEMHNSYAAGLEAAHLGTIRTTLPDGTTMVVDGIFTYRVNESGKLVSLRGFWDIDEMKVESAG